MLGWLLAQHPEIFSGVEAVLNEGIDPYAGGERPRPRTAEDYLSTDRDR